MKVDNVDRLIENLCTIWIGSYHLRANPVRFQREPLTFNSQLKKRNVVDNKKLFASILKAGNHKPVMSSEPSPSIVLDESYVSKKDLSCSLMGKIKDINALSNLYVILANEGFDNVSLTYLGGYWVLINVESISSKEKLSKHVGVASWFVELIPASNSFGSLANMDAEDDSSLPFKKFYEGSDTSSSDEEDIGGKANAFDSDKELNHVSESSYMNDYKMKANTQDFGMNKGSNPSLNFKTGGLILQVMEDLVEVGLGQSTKKNWIRELNIKFKVNFVAIQETKLETIDLFAINALWGNFAFDFAISPSVGYSSGLLCVWDPNMFSKESVTISDSFLAIRGESIILGDFNEVRAEQERFGTTFNEIGANSFNHFISSTGFIDLPLEDGFDKLVEGSWKNLACEDSNNISLLKKKFQALKALIKDWDFAQKAKIRWSIEGDENSKYFHGIINKKRSQLAICGVLVDGDWIEEPYKVKSEFLNHFTNRFSKHSGPKISFGHQMFKQLSDEQKEFLESNVTYKEIKKAVWDYGTNKSPGTDGFTFDFIHRYWKIMDQDMVNVVHEFFNSSIRIDDSLSLSHLFYADDAIFIGKWEKLNFSTIVHMLKCFFLASGLMINIQKSKLMGIGVPQEEVTTAANFIGCSTFSTPFNYLGVKVAMYDDRGSLDNPGLIPRNSLWISIIREFHNLSRKGVNLLKLMKKKVGNGMYTHFWDDPWLFDSLLMHVYPRLYTLECAKHVTVAAKLSDYSLIDSFRRPPRGGVEEELLLGLIYNVDSVILFNSNDRRVWSLESSSEFSVKTTHSHIGDFFSPSVGDPNRWIKIVPIKVNIFSWKVRLDRLPTRINLSLRGIDLPSIICPICCCTGETCSHLLFTCNVALSDLM
uniref:RNA-directed DNA polymerase, eukaryota n=1 Tax=Tanacetum cinerariifolium TaxID=118510 RepID=A0A6L2LWH2_TANCI|nr:RNA-directed DNA polymerase, eukaryota [Tanacetum cinerariifolium]